MLLEPLLVTDVKIGVKSLNRIIAIIPEYNSSFLAVNMDKIYNKRVNFFRSISVHCIWRFHNDNACELQ
jgi:hypothetical protein